MPGILLVIRKTKVSKTENVPVLTELTHILEGKGNKKGVFTCNKLIIDCGKC